ncbi:MAG: hypothetical protein U0228_38785 [Myxococcaceae bacterium]
MTFLAVLAVLVAAPRLEVASCPEELFDARVVRAQLSLERGLLEDAVSLTCVDARTVTAQSPGRQSRVVLDGATKSQRERTLSLFLSAWLRAPIAVVDAGTPIRSSTPKPPVVIDAGPSEPVVELEVIPPPEVDAGEPPPPEPAPREAIVIEPVDAGVVEPVPTSVPIELSLVPGVDLNRLFPEPTLNHLAIGLLGVRSTSVDGFSVAPLSIVDVRLRGAQLGLINVAGDVDGVQLGLLNIAKKVRGVQIGLINVADSSPASIGFLNANQRHPVRLGLSFADTHAVEVQLKSGGGAIYSVVAIGWVPTARFEAGGGVGFHLGSTTDLGWFAELELTSAAVIDFSNATLIPTFTFGFNLAYRILPRVAVLAGPRFSFLFGSPQAPGAGAALFGLPVGPSGLAIAPGAQLGVEF